MIQRRNFYVHGTKIPLFPVHVFTGSVSDCELKKELFTRGVTPTFFTRRRTSRRGPSAYSERYNGCGNKLSTKSLERYLFNTTTQILIKKRTLMEQERVDHYFPVPETFGRFAAFSAHYKKTRERKPWLALRDQERVVQNTKESKTRYNLTYEQMRQTETAWRT